MGGFREAYREIPLLASQEGRKSLKKNSFFQLQDSTSLYLGKIQDVLNEGDQAPFGYVEPKIRQLIINKRSINFIKKVKKDILEEAYGKKEFETYD